MSIDKDRIADIIYQHLQGLTLSDEQQALLAAWLENIVNKEIFDRTLDEGEWREYARIMLDKELTQRALATFAATAFDNPLVKELHPRMSPMSRISRNWLRYAAILLLIAGPGLYLYRYTHNRKTAPASVQAVVSNDVAPGTNRAVLVLGDGTQISLDSAGNGALASQGRTKIMKTGGGQIVYEPNAAGSKAGAAVLMNTMHVPKGGQYQLTLPDGTKVWLNSASSITYPTAFSGSERSATISGEAYFEVAKKVNSPFHVRIGAQAEIQVLGTSFNVNAYEDETDIRTTLLDGKIRIEQQQRSVVLAPGQQARLRTGLPATASDRRINVIGHADIDKVMAWKNGYFNFEDMQFGEAMRQLARWYDIEVVYENGIPNIPLGGETSRNLKLSDLLKGLAGAGVKYRLEQGRRLIILR
jgi:transmembrane sensor